MKKILVSAAAALLLLFGFMPRAHAEEYAQLGRFVAGQDINCFVTFLDEGASAETDALPDGCELVEERLNDGRISLLLRGRPRLAGEYNFIIRIEGAFENAIVCNMIVDPVPPLVQTGSNVECSVNSRARLSVSASVNDGGSLGYQWYSGMGLSAVPIIGETEPDYYPDTSRTGSFYYQCVITNVNGTSISSTVSEPILLTVRNPVVSSIQISTMPAKLKYYVGDVPDLAGIQLKVNMDSGESSIIAGGFTTEPALFTAAGTQTVRVSYGGVSCSFTVEVVNKNAAVTGIGVVTLPAKQNYKVGERLEPAGLSIRVYTADKNYFDVSEGLSCAPELLTREGKQEITVSYGGKTCTFSVKVEEEKETVRSVSVATRPTKLDYTVGDTLDPTGLSIRVISNKKTEDISSGFSCTPKLLTTAGVQKITVVYGQYSCTFDVNVKAKAAATPAPTNSPAPVNTAVPSVPPLNIPGAAVSPAASAEPGAAKEPVGQSSSRSDRDGRRDSDPTTALVKFGLIVAIAALVGIAACVYVLNNKNIDFSKIFKGRRNGR